MSPFDFEFPNRPVVSIRGRRYVLLDDLQPVLGVQILPAADVTPLVVRDAGPVDDPACVPAWYDGSGVCYVRARSGPAARLGVIDLPLWIGPHTRGNGAQLAQPA